MKFVILILVSMIFLAVVWYLIVRSKTELIGVSNLNGQFKDWVQLNPSEKSDVQKAFELTKSVIPETLNLRIKSRNSTISNELPVTVYYVRHKNWLYIFADNYPFKAPGIELTNGLHLKNSIHYDLITGQFELKL